jgi:hypothetical protein
MDETDTVHTQDSLKAIENSVMLSMDGIVRSFAQQANPKADFFCHVARESFDLALSALSQICAASANEGKCTPPKSRSSGHVH